MRVILVVISIVLLLIACGGYINLRLYMKKHMEETVESHQKALIIRGVIFTAAIVGASIVNFILILTK